MCPIIINFSAYVFAYCHFIKKQTIHRRRKDMIVHVFDEENRLFYDLERIWRDGKVLDVNEFLEK